MKLDTLTLAARITKNTPLKKLTVYQYLWTDLNAVEEAGLGPRTITVEGVVETTADRDVLEQALEAPAEKKLYFPSEQGGTDDRYYKVHTHPAAWTPQNAAVCLYSFDAIAADPRIYDADTDLPIW